MVAHGVLRIAVISDTHVGSLVKGVPDEMWELTESADLVVHLGDFTSEDFARELEVRSRALRAVSGNRDGEDVRRMFPAVVETDLGGVSTLLVHEFPAARRTGAEIAALESRGIALVLFGHTHVAADLESGGVRMLNPGSVADGGRSHGGRTAGLLLIRGRRLSWRLVPMERR